MFIEPVQDTDPQMQRETQSLLFGLSNVCTQIRKDLLHLFFTPNKKTGSVTIARAVQSYKLQKHAVLFMSGNVRRQNKWLRFRNFSLTNYGGVYLTTARNKMHKYVTLRNKQYSVIHVI